MTEDTTTPAPDTTDAPATPKFKYGFAVLVAEDDSVFIEKNPQIFAIPVDREPTLVEIRRYTSEILMDLQAQAAGEYSSLRIMAMQEAQKQPNQ